MGDDIQQSTSHKGEKRRSFTMGLKSSNISFAKENSINAASKRFNVDRKRVREWCQNEEKSVGKKTPMLGAKRKRLDGAGRSLMDEQLEQTWVEWVLERRSNLLRISQKMIMVKAKSLFDEKHSDPTEEDSFLASTGWINRFLTRNGLSLRRRTTAAQKDPAHVVDKIALYILNVRRLLDKFSFTLAFVIAMDETLVWADMVSSTTISQSGKRNIPLKTTGHEKVRVSVCLTAKWDGNKLKPFIVFCGAKRECKSLNDEFKHKCVVQSSSNVWMNDYPVV